MRAVNRLGRAVMSCYPFPRGQGRIIDRTFLSRLRFDEPTLLVRTSDGFDLRVMPNDHIGRHVFLTGQFDRTVAEVVLSRCPPDARILDIGANIGYVACVLLNRLPRARIAAVEPHPVCFGLLAENLDRVGPGRSVPVNAAVSDRTGTGALVLAPANSGRSHLVDGPHAGSNVDTVAVPLITGAELLERSGLGRVDAIKIDVEGHEASVLRSLAPVLARHRPRIVVFEHHGALDAASPLVREVFDPVGYEVLAVSKSLLRWRLERPDDLHARGRCTRDYAAIPREEGSVA